MFGPQRISTGEFVALVHGLPASGAVARAEGAWADETELLAGAVEHLDAIARLLYGQSGKRPPWPAVRIPRPAGDHERKRPAMPDRMTAMLRRAEGEVT